MNIKLDLWKCNSLSPCLRTSKNHTDAHTLRAMSVRTGKPLLSVTRFQVLEIVEVRNFKSIRYLYPLLENTSTSNIQKFQKFQKWQEMCTVIISPPSLPPLSLPVLLHPTSTRTHRRCVQCRCDKATPISVCNKGKWVFQNFPEFQK